MLGLNRSHNAIIATRLCDEQAYCDILIHAAKVKSIAARLVERGLAYGQY